MGIEHYAFAFFIAILLSLLAVLFKALFANVRQQTKLLDEKETKLLQLYQSIEGIMEEFSAQVDETTRELKGYEDRIAKRAVEPAPPPRKPPEPAKKEQVEKLPRALTVDESRIRVATEVIERAERVIKGDVQKQPTNAENGPVFQRFFDDAVNDMQAVDAEAAAKQKRSEAIRTLVEQGKTYAQIAEVLGITQNEVKFIVELGRI